MNIKDLKPKKDGRYKQGYINPNSCKKLFGGISHEPIIYRSSYELKFIQWLEGNKEVKLWGSECLKIPYFNPKDQKWHSYYPDYFVEMNNGTKIVVEIKPKNQTQKPINENSWAYNEYIRNMCKWRSTKEFCEAKGYEFKILTENTINKL
jgi:hypothetical protein